MRKYRLNITPYAGEQMREIRDYITYELLSCVAAEIPCQPMRMAGRHKTFNYTEAGSAVVGSASCRYIFGGKVSRIADIVQQ